MLVRLESLAVTKLNLYFYDEVLGPATGFIYQYGQNIALVSNWHVFSGVNPLTGNPRDQRGFCPNRVEFNINLFDPKDGSVFIRPFEQARLQIAPGCRALGGRSAVVVQGCKERQLACLCGAGGGQLRDAVQECPSSGKACRRRQ